MTDAEQLMMPPHYKRAVEDLKTRFPVVEVQFQTAENDWLAYIGFAPREREPKNGHVTLWLSGLDKPGTTYENFLAKIIEAERDWRVTPGHSLEELMELNKKLAARMREAGIPSYAELMNTDSEFHQAFCDSRSCKHPAHLTPDSKQTPE